MTTLNNVDELGRQLMSLHLIESQVWDECLSELDPGRHQSKHLIRALVKTRTLNIVLGCQSFGRRGGQLSHRQIQAVARLARGAAVAVIVVLSEQQEKWKDSLERSKSARVLTQPITLEDLYCKIKLSLEAFNIEPI